MSSLEDSVDPSSTIPDSRRNIVIIGGGIIGVCTAYYLVKAVNEAPTQTAVTILETNEIASGASGKAGGFLAKDWHSRSTSSLGHLSFALHADLAREFDGRVAYGYRRVKCFGGTVDVPEEEEEPDKDPDTSPKGDAGKHPEHIVNVPSAQPTRTQPPPLDSSSPGSSPDTPTWLRTPENFSLIADEETTAQVHPYLFTKSIFQECLKLGVKYVQGRALTWNRDRGVLSVVQSGAIPGEGSGVSEPLVAHHNLPVTTLIITAGPWSGRVVKDLTGINVPMAYLPGHSLILQSHRQLEAHSAFIEIRADKRKSLVIGNMTRTPEIFLRPDGTIYVAGENTGAPLPNDTRDVDGVIDPEAIEKLRRVIGALGIKGVELREQLCYRPLTQRGVPIIGKLEDEVYIATGHGPWGISLAPGTGKVLSELVLGRSLSADISSLEPRMHL